MTARRMAFGLGLVAVVVQAALVLGINGAKVVKGRDEPDLFHRYATRAIGGEVPYRDYPVEYPPLAFPLFLAPALVTRSLEGYKVAFAVEMLAFHAAAVLLVALRVGREEGVEKVPRRMVWSTLIVLILSRLMITRYDAAPMLLGFAASLWWASGRGGLGGLAAALGALAKVYPGVVAALGVVADRKRPGAARFRGAFAFGLASAVGLAGWVGVGGVRGVVDSLRYHSGRGFEYGSVYSGLQMLAAKVLGAEIVVSRDHASFSTITPWSGPLLALVPPLQAAALLAACVVFARRGGRDLLRYSGAAVLGFIVTGKVFSPQYLIWMMPYVAVLRGAAAARCRWLFAATCALTQLAPAALNHLPRTGLGVILAYDARNILIVWLWVVLVFGPAGPEGDRPG